MAAEIIDMAKLTERRGLYKVCACGKRHNPERTRCRTKLVPVTLTAEQIKTAIMEGFAASGGEWRKVAEASARNAALFLDRLDEVDAKVTVIGDALLDNGPEPEPVIVKRKPGRPRKTPTIS